MKIKRYFAPDIRRALQIVREEQGPNAVILSNQRVEGGVELVAAIDYDESLLQNESGRSANSHARGNETYEQRASSMASYSSDEPVELQDEQQPIRSRKREPIVEPIPGPITERPRQTQAKDSLSDVVWSQDPVLREMRGELKQLRGMLENQLSGLAWGDMSRREPLRADLIQKLMALGLSADLCQEVTDAVAGSKDSESAWQAALRYLERLMPAAPADDILTHGGVVALIGPTGVGKTTTIAKLAAHYALRYGNRHVALVTIDCYRVGAYEQLRTYGRILDIPVKIADNKQELRKVLDDLCDRRLVLIDTAGMSQRNDDLMKQLSVLGNDDRMIKKTLVMPATTRLSGLDEVVSAFGTFQPDSCILTKLDESTSLGEALSTSIKYDLPISYICDGQRVPEDIHTARADDMVRRAVEFVDEKKTEQLDESMAPLKYGQVAANARY